MRTLVRHAHLLDGTGAAARPADILLSGPVIEAVEAPGRIAATDCAEIDATGLIVAPGFIDVHSHADNAPFLSDDDTSKVLQGVTSEVVGNCGFSLAPLTAEHEQEAKLLSQRIFPPLPWHWHTFADYLAESDAAGHVTNQAPLVGHNSLRVGALGMSDAVADEAALRRMGELLDEALEAGAFGLSSGLAYPPGVFSGAAELAALARRLPAGRPYTSHIRGEARSLPASIGEALDVGRRSGRRVQISHLKAAGRAQWGSMPGILTLLDRAREDGVDVAQDVYPYTASSTMLTATLPPWVQVGGKPAVLQRLCDPADRDRIRAALDVDDGSWENPVAGAGWAGVVIASSRSGEFDGRSLQQIAEDCGIEPFDALVRVLVTEELEASMIVHSMCEQDLEAVLRHPLTMIGSDGLPPGLGGKPHPRMYGTFPRVLARYVAERKVLELPEAIRRMTSLPAATFGLTDRGSVRPGLAADLVAFDPAAVADTATYADPVRAPRGLAWVRVNGVEIARDGRYLGGRTGIRLRPA